VISFTSGQVEAWIALYLWPFVRILALFSSAPLLYHRSVPMRVKVGLSLLITIIVVPALPAAALGPAATPAGLSAGNAAWLLVQQLLVGFAIGFALQMVFAAFEIAGDLLGLQMGLSFAAFVDPQNAHQSPLIGSFIGLMATLVFLAMDGHLMMIAGIVESFRTIPVGSATPGPDNLQALALAGGEMFRVGLHLALPVLATMLILNLALGVLARAAPQLNIFAVGFPATILIGLAALALIMPLLGPFLEGSLHRGLAGAFALVGR
jgi:flagellar biosynthetic protein FliR